MNTALIPNLMPVLFVSHGAPTFGLVPGKLGPKLRRLANVIQKPRAILVVSPHWMTIGASVTRTLVPETIYDFGSFPRPLYSLKYPAPGSPGVAAAAMRLLLEAGWTGEGDDERGLDHGVWIPLLHMYPDADVPVFQVSMPGDLDERSAYAMGQALAPLRQQGVLIVGSGSLTHNLYEFTSEVDAPEAAYVKEFERWAADTVSSRDHERLMNTMSLAPHASRAHPSTDHLLPLMFASGAAGQSEEVTLINGGVTHGVLSMDSYVFGLDAAASQLLNCASK